MAAYKRRAGMIIIFLAICVALFWRCFYGYAFVYDEGFYPTIAFRLIQGDKLLYDEWHVVQLSGVVLMPLLKIYLWVNGSTDGVYLASRFAYTFLKILISILIWRKLNRYNKAGSYLSSLTFLLFAGNGVMALSYNSIAIGGGNGRISAAS